MDEPDLPVWMRDRLIAECANGTPEPLSSWITEGSSRAFAVELRDRLAAAADPELLQQVDVYFDSGRWLAAIGVAASACLTAGVRVPFRIMDFDEVCTCDVHDAILDDFECVISSKFLEPDQVQDGR